MDKDHASGTAESDENQKDPHRITPMTIQGVKPGSYDLGTDTAGGSQDKGASSGPEAGRPYGTGPADPAGKQFDHVSDGARKIAARDAGR